MSPGTAAAAATCGVVEPRLVDHRVRLPVDANPVPSDTPRLPLDVAGGERRAAVLVLHRHVGIRLRGPENERRHSERVANSHGEMKQHPTSALRRHVPTDETGAAHRPAESRSINMTWAGSGARTWAGSSARTWAGPVARTLFMSRRTP